jgi:hypothetical protein
MPTIDHAQQLLDLQAAMRALWPDRKVVYFTEASANSQGPGVVLTRDEQDQLTRVAQAIGAARYEAAGDLAELRAMKARLDDRRSSLGLDRVNYQACRMLDEIAGDL